MRYIQRFIDQIKNFFYWGWKLRASHDWDHAFLLELMLLKLQRMENYHLKYGVSVDSEDPRSTMMKSMRLCIALLKRLLDRSDFMYAIHAEAAHKAKWGDVEIIEKPYEDKPSLLQVTVTRKNVNPDNEKQYEKESKDLTKFSYMIYCRDKKLLFDIISKHLTEWWD